MDIFKIPTVCFAVMVLVSACNLSSGASSGPPPDVSPTQGAAEPEPAVLASQYGGEMAETIGDLRTFEITLAVHSQSGNAFDGVFEVVESGTVLESYAVSGSFDDDRIEFTEPLGRYFWGTVQGPSITGFIAWGCFDCDHWATFELRDGATVPAPQGELPLIRFTDVADGGVVNASLDEASGLPTAVVQIESDVDIGFLTLGLDADGLMVAHYGYEPSASLPYQREIIWTPWHGNGEYVLTVSLLDWDTEHRVLSTETVVVQVVGLPEGAPTIAERFVGLYRENFGLNLTSPAFARYNRLFADAVDDSRWVSSAYIGDTLYEITIFDDGRVNATTYALNSDAGLYCRPVGLIRMLAVVVDYGNTGSSYEEAVADLRFALDQSNGRWAEYSAQLGLSEPILQVELATAYAGSPITQGQLLTTTQIRDLTGYGPGQFDVTAELDLDANNLAVGQYGGRGVSLGGGCRPSGSNALNIGMNINRSGYSPGQGAGSSIFDHELTHGMGWMHWWPNQYADSQSWINTYSAWQPYLLFGWTDTDGDGVIEILDPTPYGLY